MKPVALGVVGCGVIGNTHMRAASKLSCVRLAAVADVREDAAREAAGKYGVPAVYTDAGQLFADPEVEAVVLCLPTCWRTPLALRAFAHGKHALIEKPIAMDAAQARELIAARGELIAGCCSSRFRFLPSAEVVASVLASGALGELRLIRCRGTTEAGPQPKKTPPAWRLIRAQNGGGILMNWGCYDLDYILGISGWSLEPELVLGQTWPVSARFVPHVAPGSDAETHVAALIRCRNGVTIAYERGEYLATREENAIHLVGSLGALRFSMTPDEGKTIVHDDTTVEEGVSTEVIWEGDESYDMINAGLLSDFAQAVREGRQPRTSLEQALLVQRISDAIYASAAQGTAVAL